LGAGAPLAPLGLLALSFILMLTAWTYCLRGWLAALMINKRRRRTIIVWMTIAFVLVFQIPNLLLNTRMLNHAHPALDGHASGSTPGEPESKREDFISKRLLTWHLVVPLGWPGYGAMSLKSRHSWPTLLLTSASLIIGWLGLLRAYRMTLRFYQG